MTPRSATAARNAASRWLRDIVVTALAVPENRHEVAEHFDAVSKASNRRTAVIFTNDRQLDDRMAAPFGEVQELDIEAESLHSLQAEKSSRHWASERLEAALRILDACHERP